MLLLLHTVLLIVVNREKKSKEILVTGALQTLPDVLKYFQG